MNNNNTTVNHFVRIASSTFLFMLFAFTSFPAQSALLATWDNWTLTSEPYIADDTLTGFSANLNQVGSSTSRINGTFGSSDGTFGSIGSAANTAGSLLVRANTANTYLFNITNSSGVDYTLDSLHFDFGPREQGNDTDYGFNEFTLTYLSGGLGPDATEIDAQSGLAYVIVGTTNPLEDLPDYNYNLSDDLSDVVLANGESAQFEIVFDGNAGSNGGNVSSVLDNIAFQGTAIPEPGTLILFLLGITGGFFLSGKRRS